MTLPAQPQTIAETIFAALSVRQDLLIALTDPSGRVLWANAGFVERTGQDIQHLLGQRFFLMLISGSDAKVQGSYIRERLLKGQSFQFELPSQSIAETPSWLLIDGQPIYDSEGNVIQYLLIAQDTTLRKEAEFDLRTAKQALEAANQDLEARIQQRTIALIQAKEKAEQTLKELKQTQLQLIQSEKMSSLGQLVAGIAHEINNPVNFVTGNIVHAANYVQDLLQLIQLYQEAYPHPNSMILEHLQLIDFEFLAEDLPLVINSMTMGTKRIQEIIRSLRNFSRLDESESKIADIHEGINNTLVILHNRLKIRSNHPEIRVIKRYGDLPLVECYPGQLNQVFMNILSNAIDALEERDEKRSLASLQTDPSEITITTQNQGNGKVSIAIADNGPGIKEETRNRIFDPFFTTKPVGKGTGLGLSISYQIVVEKHGGQMQCFSQLGQGTTFLIEIPLTQKPAKLA